MDFILGRARLHWNQDKGYRHPRDGRWVATPLECLRSWQVSDSHERREWSELINYIEEFWRHQPMAPPDHDMEVLFEPSASAPITESG